MTETEIQIEALSRARNGSSVANDLTVIAHFAEKGIPIADIQPRENVLTYNAWKAVGRFVRKGEKSCRVQTWIPVRDKDTGKQDGVRPKTAFVFHVSQTDATKKS